MTGSAPTRKRGTPAKFVLAAIACVAAITEAWRAISMATGDDRGIHRHVTGMPVSDMPFMFIAGAAIITLILMVTFGQFQPATTPITGRNTTVQIGVFTAALTIDVSKTATLGFVMPGLRSEYGLSPQNGSLLAVAGLTGTLIGSILVWGTASRWSRRDVFLVSCLTFAATSCCGLMPTFTGNLVMCFLMGISVGGLAPVLVAAIRDATASGSAAMTVTTGILAAALGYLAAAITAAALIPTFGWRIMWLIGAPTGVLLVLLTPLVPNVGIRSGRLAALSAAPAEGGTVIRCVFAVAVGLVTFGVTTWAPTIAALGRTSTAHGSGDRNLAVAALALIPFAVLVGAAYSRVGARATLAVPMVGCALAVGMLLVASGTVTAAAATAAALITTLFMVNLMSAILMPVAAERGSGNRLRRVASTAAFYRVGGLFGPLLLARFVSDPATVRVALGVLVIACLVAAAGVIRYLPRTAPAAVD